MKKYLAPEMEMIVLQSADCITSSNGISVGDYEDPDQQDNLSFNTFFGS